MALRLGNSNNSASSRLLQTFEHDVNVSSQVKVEVFTFLGVILNNLITHPEEVKYRQLRLSNPKNQRLTSHITIRSFLQDAIGFDSIVEDGETFLRIPEVRFPTQETLAGAKSDISAARDRIERTLEPSVNKKNTPSSSSNNPPQVLTERQKARQLAEEAAILEKQAIAKSRKRTVALIQTDKHVRANDPNWKPSVSAAAAKSGDAMTTFRDKFGEN